MPAVYKDQILAVEPTGIEPVAAAQRHGSPRKLFGIWFSANAEIATWMVGVFIVALFGADLRSAAAGIVIGNLAGYGILGLLACFGPRYGVPQMVSSRLAFGVRGNVAPATLAFVAGVGWFAINTIFGAYALQTIAGFGYPIALALMLGLQIVIAVYGYNLIAWFEGVCAVLLAAGFALVAFKTIPLAAWSAPFYGHAPLAQGGSAAAFIFSVALSFSYATGWVPYASDYSRYLPASSAPAAVWWYSFAGCALPCILLEILGAAAVTAVPHVDLSSAIPTEAIDALLGSGAMAKLVLATVVLGTLTANCMNLYSGVLAALVAFGVRMRRATAALAVGLLGAALAALGHHPRDTADLYANFLLLLSYWVAPWAAVVLVDYFVLRRERGDRPESATAWRFGTFAWLLGCAASVPFWNQLWFAGPVARAHPELGDLSYEVGFGVAGIAMLAYALLRRARTAA